jgi:hypothetical protein
MQTYILKTAKGCEPMKSTYTPPNETRLVSESLLLARKEIRRWRAWKGKGADGGLPVGVEAGLSVAVALSDLRAGAVPVSWVGTVEAVAEIVGRAVGAVDSGGVVDVEELDRAAGLLDALEAEAVAVGSGAMAAGSVTVEDCTPRMITGADAGAGATVEAGTVAGKRKRLAWVAEALLLITDAIQEMKDDATAEPLTVAEIARRVGVHKANVGAQLIRNPKLKSWWGAYQQICDGRRGTPSPREPGSFDDF